MKKLAFILVMSLSVSAAFSQEDFHFTSGKEKHDGKPQQFKHLSSKFSVKPGFLNEILSVRLDEQVSFQLADGFVFSGKVITKTRESNGLEIVTVESQQKKGLILSVSKFTKADGSIDFMGLITSRDISDMIMLEKDIITGNYMWTRKNLSQMIAD
ncbi:hypothetical protein PDL71_02930 [Lacibacter sp. MH-610]|uniref:hypothetical protein n=1 Tax=Lacibacter sp. MH-610 TaxID=3020883 RepID=UPI00389280B0